MTDRPILFSAPMVRALLDGSKTQTRRVLNPQPQNPCSHVEPFLGEGGGWIAGDNSGNILNIRFAPGDRLYVRESFCISLPGGHAVHRASMSPEMLAKHEGIKWKPSIHMPRWASRLTLAVTDVRVQRLKDISEEDAQTEGVEALDSARAQGDFDERDNAVCPECGGTRLHGALGGNGGWTEVDCTTCDTHKKRFQHLWDSINNGRTDKDGSLLPYAWDDNPWVVAISFDVHKGNIDTMDDAS